MTTTTGAAPATAAARMSAAWQRLSALPGGKTIFSIFVGRTAPYSGSIGARVVELRPGYALVRMRERRRLRNHLRSVHAIALANLGELASGLAMTLAFAPNVRGIPVSIAIDYRKKARGVLLAEGTASPPTVTGPVDAEARAEIRDEGGDVVATMIVQWRLDLA
jgi:acyl-coenzyme A thioesterase PaaI-like protein